MKINTISLVSETKLATIAIDGGKSKGSALCAYLMSKPFLVSETKLAAIAIDGGKSKGSAFNNL